MSAKIGDCLLAKRQNSKAGSRKAKVESQKRKRGRQVPALRVQQQPATKPETAGLERAATNIASIHKRALPVGHRGLKRRF
ncbi:hypothetical protein [Flaviaesturariibacter amylovorans]|uniref:hypothetical protein n=1 Tax=Flaviaesturariibacter amylovorans TaxID=1084520 RepID=UPI0031ED9801